MTPEELREQIHKHGKKLNSYKHHVNVCAAAGCVSAGSGQLIESMQSTVKEKGLQHDCLVRGVGCMGLCSKGPLVSVDHDKVMYEMVKSEHADKIISSLDKKPVSSIVCDTSIPFFSRQEKVVLENSGCIDPENLDDYLNAGGYEALIDCISDRGSNEIIDIVTDSGLRGRGGGGYPTGLKWGTVEKADGKTKYVVCNADEGDPGAFMDRCILESDPHRVIEGMAIAAMAVGAQYGYVYVRAEYPLAIARLRKAINQARRYNLLGDSILGSPFSFSIEIRLGAGAFVCGEETALIASIQGLRGTPRPRPPYPAELGVWGCPTLINNVETYANVPPILRNGAEWYAGKGTDCSKGTKVFALAGQVKNTGLIEVPMGITLREIIFDIGGGVPEGRKFKAVQTGGPSGGCIPEAHLDIPVDYESLREFKSIMGSGGMIVMDESSDMVDVARFFMEFCVSESCGKCVPCRAGTPQMLTLLETIAAGNGTDGDLEMLKDLCEMTQKTSLCGLGQTAPNPVLSTLHFFEDEYTGKLIKTNGKKKQTAKSKPRGKTKSSRPGKKVNA